MQNAKTLQNLDSTVNLLATVWGIELKIKWIHGTESLKNQISVYGELQ